MSLRKIRSDDTETFSVETHPSRTYSSSSRSGPTGSVNVFAWRSSAEKDVGPPAFFQRGSYHDTDLDQLRNQAVLEATASAKTNKGSLLRYLDSVFSQSQSTRKAQTVEILRFTPPTSLNSDTLRKAVVTETLMPFYRASYPSAQFGYSNFHTLCFFTASGYSADAAVLYPNPRRAGSTTLSEYGTTGSFSFDFWINPRFTTDAPNGTVPWKAATIVHLTSSYALSLITGSLRDENGFPKGFRLLLQLSESADIPPSIALGTFILSGASAEPQTRFVYASDDNSLLRNRWQHVTVRWGGPNYNQGSGSFVIDQVTRGSWVCTASMVLGDYDSLREPAVLTVGNYYRGTNTGTSALTRWFSNLPATREGLLELDSTTDVVSPAAYLFDHPLNAEIHDLKFFDKYLIDPEVANLQETGPTLGTLGLRFWVPPFFTKESPSRVAVNGAGGLMVSPFQVKNGSNTLPYNPWLSLTCGGHQISLENHLRDLVTGRYPRAHAMTASILDTDSQVPTECNQILYNTASNQKSLYLISPSDNGLYTPRFDALDSLSQERFVSDVGVRTRGLVSLRDLLSGSYNQTKGLVHPSGSIVEPLLGPTPEDFTGTLRGDSLAVLHRTRDNTSNQVVLFDISNLFYGTQIRPGTFVLQDSNLSGSGGKLGMTLRDNGEGNLYRADALTDHASWSSVGNIFYNEGLILLKDPSLYFFGSQQFEMSFQGVQGVHVLRFNLVAGSGMLTTSSNATYSPYLSASLNANDTDRRFVYITNVLVHDDNLNVIMRTNIAQPVVKRHGDRLMFRPKMDF